MSGRPIRLAVLATHPIQYYAPWFQLLAARAGLRLRVFYLWDFGVSERVDPGFGVALKWDLSLLDGYDSSFVPNRSGDPGTHRFLGLRNPGLVAEVAGWSPDAVLLMGYNYLSLVTFIAAWNGRCPLLFRGDSHRLFRPRLGAVARGKEALKRGLITLLFRRFDAFLSVGRANRDYYLIHGAGTGRIFPAPHAVDNGRFGGAGSGGAETGPAGARDWRRSLGLGEDERVVLFAGKLEEKKRPGDLLEAFQRIGPERAALVFVGAGPLEAELRRRSGGNAAVRFAPFQNQSAMPAVYASAEVFVLPSFGRYETWGLAVNEAMCAGVPGVVSSHVGCAADLVTPGETGWVFPAGDTDALGRCLRDALADDHRRRRMGAAARARVIEQYNYERMTDGLERALHAVADRPHGVF